MLPRKCTYFLTLFIVTQIAGTLMKLRNWSSISYFIQLIITALVEGQFAPVFD